MFPEAFRPYAAALSAQSRSHPAVGMMESGVTRFAEGYAAYAPLGQALALIPNDLTLSTTFHRFVEEAGLMHPGFPYLDVSRDGDRRRVEFEHLRAAGLATSHTVVAEGEPLD